MIRVADRPLAAADRQRLAALQAGVDAAGDYPARVAAAKAGFAAKPRALFDAVRANLKQMTGELIRCHYCEDSCADEVEHVRPKDFFPEAVFSWPNYLFACGPCNGPKLNHWDRRLPDGTIVDLAVERRLAGIVTPPPAGEDLLIDPRVEDPLAYLWLDIVGGTFRFAILDEDDADAARRAATTIDLPKLNKREYLVAARANAYQGYLARLESYVTKKASGTEAGELARLATDLQRTPHRTVWLEMQRQRDAIAPLTALFAAVPEALAW